MPEAKYTPGPWREHNGTIMAGDEVLAMAFRSGKPWSERNANARAMAATPEMVKVLEAIQKLGVSSINISTRDMVRAVLAKAKGK